MPAMLLAMSSSKNPSDRKTFLEYAYGKVKEELDLTSKGEKLSNIIGVNVIDYRNGLAPLAPRSIPDSDPSSEDENSRDGAEMGKDGARRSADDDSA